MLDVMASHLPRLTASPCFFAFHSVHSELSSSPSWLPRVLRPHSLHLFSPKMLSFVSCLIQPTVNKTMLPSLEWYPISPQAQSTPIHTPTLQTSGATVGHLVPKASIINSRAGPEIRSPKWGSQRRSAGWGAPGASREDSFLLLPAAWKLTQLTSGQGSQPTPVSYGHTGHTWAAWVTPA